jgi:hypothetical protein
MANIYSDIMANLSTLGGPLVEPYYESPYWKVRRGVAVVTLDGTQSDGDVVRFLQIRSDWVIHSLRLSNDALAGATSADLGLYLTNGGAAVDDDLFASAFTLASATVRVEKRVGIGSLLDFAGIQNEVWQLLGLAKDPGRIYDVTLLLNTAGSASGDIMLDIEYGNIT